MSSTLASWNYDVGGDRCSISPLGAEFYNLDTAEAAAGLPLASYEASFHPDDLAPMRRKIARLSDGGTLEETYRVRRREGGYRWVSAYGQGVAGKDGRSLWTTGFVIDVSDGSRWGEPDVLAYTPYDAAADLLMTAHDMARIADDPVLKAHCEPALRHVAMNIARQSILAGP